MPKSTRRPRPATGNALADRQAELDDLIRQQAADERSGDRVYGPQIDYSLFNPDHCAGPDPEPLDALPRLDFKARAARHQAARRSPLMGIGPVWDSSIVAYDGRGRCPACLDIPPSGESLSRLLALRARRQAAPRRRHARQADCPSPQGEDGNRNRQGRRLAANILLSTRP